MVKLTKVYTDGSVFNNQKNKLKKTTGGIGVYFGDEDERNVSLSYYDDNLTNNRTEFMAIIMAIENYSKSIVDDNVGKLVINSDSEYVIKSMTIWIKKWKLNKWKTSNGKDVLNKDLITRLDTLINNSNFEIEFRHVRAHKKEPEDKNTDEYLNWYGNMMADKFARSGSSN